MKWIKAEGVNFKYIFPEDNIMKEEEKLFKKNTIIDMYNIPVLRGSDLSYDLYEILQKGDNTRLAIFKFPRIPKTKGSKITFYDVPFCIIWPNNDIDLNELDRKIKNNTFGDEDFKHSIIAHVQKVFCRYCHEKYVAIVVEGDGLYVVLDDSGKIDTSSASDLFKRKRAILKFGKCPNCNTPLGLYVAKFLYT